MQHFPCRPFFHRRTVGKILSVEDLGREDVEFEDKVCDGIECGYYSTVLTRGGLAEGSSGSGLINTGKNGGCWSG